MLWVRHLALPMVVLEDSSIHSYEDLAGKRVGLSPVGSSTADVLNLVFELTACLTPLQWKTYLERGIYRPQGRPYRRHGRFLGQWGPDQRADRAEATQGSAF